MEAEKFFDLILDLEDDWHVKSTDLNFNKLEVYIEVEYRGKQAECPETLEMCSIYDYKPERIWRHLNTQQYNTFIKCRLPRVKNKDGRVLTVKAPWADKSNRYTYLFEKAVIDLLLASKNQAQIAKFLNCGANVIGRIMHKATKRGLSRRELADASFKHLSMDEKSFKKGHKYVTVLSDPVSGCVINVAENRDTEAVSELLDKTLTKEQRKEVDTISIDMWKPYLKVSEEKLTNAEVVHDKFHLIKYLNDAIDNVRRREVKNKRRIKKYQVCTTKE